jgi:hypothetical protein
MSEPLSERVNWTEEWGPTAIQSLDDALDVFVEHNVEFSTRKNPSRPGMMICDFEWRDPGNKNHRIRGGGHGLIQRDCIIDAANAFIEPGGEMGNE